MSKESIWGFEASPLKVGVYSRSLGVSEYMKRALAFSGFKKTSSSRSILEAALMMNEFNPDVMLICAYAKNSSDLKEALAVNKIRKSSMRRTPKILALYGSSLEDMKFAASVGFYDIMPLPVTLGILRSRIEKANDRFC